MMMMMMMMMMTIMNNQNKSQLLGVQVFMVRDGTKTCVLVSYLILRSSTHGRVSEEKTVKKESF